MSDYAILAMGTVLALFGLLPFAHSLILNLGAVACHLDGSTICYFVRSF